MRPLLTLLVALAPCAGAPTPAAAAGLTTAQYAALDQALAAFVPLSADRPPASGFDTARSACRELDSSDPLLGPLRRSCTAGVRVSRTSWAFMDCLTARGLPAHRAPPAHGDDGADPRDAGRQPGAGGEPDHRRLPRRAAGRQGRTARAQPAA